MGTGERAPISIFARHLGIWPETIWPWPLCDTMCAPLFFVHGDDDDDGGGVEEESHSWKRRWWKCQLPWQQKCFAMEEVQAASVKSPLTSGEKMDGQVNWSDIHWHQPNARSSHHRPMTKKSTTQVKCDPSWVSHLCLMGFSLRDVCYPEVTRLGP